METKLKRQPQVTCVPGELMPLIRLVRDMLWELGYAPINPAFLELLCQDVELLAVMQKIAFRLCGQEGKPCQK